MDIILDTNIIRGDLFFESTNFELLFDFIEKTKSKLIMTQLVWEEILSLYHKEISSQYSKLKTARQQLGRLVLDDSQELPEVKLDIKTNQEKYKDLLCKKMAFSEGDIFPYKDSYLRDLVPRAIDRRKPFTKKGEEFRDAVLWLSVLDVAESNETKTVVFISENKHQFAAEKYHKAVPEIPDSTLLDPELAKEVSCRGVNVIYHISVESFLKSKATTVEYVTKEWLISQLRQYKVNDELLDRLNEYAVDDFREELHYHYSHVSSCGVDDALISDIKDFFVYETSSGSFFVIAIVSFNIQGSLEYEREVEEPDYDTDVDEEGNRISYICGSYTRLEEISEDFDGEINVTLSIILRNESIDKVHIEDWDIIDVRS